MPARIIAVANQKGGVAKTTTTAAMAAALTRRGFRVLAVDLDPQGNLSLAAGAEALDGRPTVFEVMKGEVPAAEAVVRTAAFDILPANILLSGAEQVFSSIGKEYVLREALEQLTVDSGQVTVGERPAAAGPPVDPNISQLSAKIPPAGATVNCQLSTVNCYDFILIDTPPSLGLLTVNALACAGEILVPTGASIFAVTGIEQLQMVAENVRKYCNPGLALAGILVTRYNPRTTISRQLRDFTEQVAGRLGTRVFETAIRASVVVEEAQAAQTDLFAWAESSPVAEDYQKFVNEFLELKMDN